MFQNGFYSLMFLHIDGDFLMEGMELSTPEASVGVEFHTQDSEYLKKNIFIFD
jgi:hypothetical protein